VALSAATASSATFFSTATTVNFLSAAALSSTTASSVTFFAVVASVTSFSVAALEITDASSAVLDAPGAATGDAAADEPGHCVETVIGAYCPIGGGH
jgi:hypothetical protein